jgi:hypothetical protein
VAALSLCPKNRQSQEDTFRAIRVDLVTGEGNGVRVLLTADGGTVAVLKFERLPDIARRGARRGIVQGVPAASRVTVRSGEEQLEVAATRFKVHYVTRLILIRGVETVTYRYRSLQGYQQ